MLNTNIISARSLQKSYKSIIEGVKNEKRAVVLTTNDKPQVAIITLEDLEKLKAVKSVQASLSLLKLAVESKEQLKNLPANLRDRADEILYNK